MADTDNKDTQQPKPGVARRTPVIAEVQTDTHTALDVPMQGKVAEGSAVTTNQDAVSLTIDTETGRPEADAPAEQPQPEGDEPAPEAAEPEGERPASVEALPDYDPENAEVTAQYEGRYFTEQGTLNLVALTTEYWSNAKDGKPGALHEGTYKYLEGALGVSKETAQEIEKGLVAQRQAEVSQFFQRVGGRKRYEAAVAWARKSYAQGDKDRFNAAVNGSDVGARDDAVDAMLARYDRANPGQRQFQRRGPPRRNAAPDRSVSSSASPASGGATQAAYASREAYTDAFNKAIAAEHNAKTPAERREATAAREKVRQDGRASQRFWK